MIYSKALVSILPYISIEVFLLNWCGILAPMYLLNDLKWVSSIGWLWIRMPPNLIGHIFGLLQLVWVLVFPAEVYWGRENTWLKKSEKMLAMAPPNLWCTIINRIETKDVFVTSMDECSRSYGANKKTRIIIGTVLEAEIGPKVITPGRRRTFVVEKFDPGGEKWKWPPSK